MMILTHPPAHLMYPPCRCAASPLRGELTREQLLLGPPPGFAQQQRRSAASGGNSKALLAPRSNICKGASPAANIGSAQEIRPRQVGPPLALSRFFLRGRYRLKKPERGANNSSLSLPLAAVAVVATRSVVAVPAVQTVRLP